MGCMKGERPRRPPCVLVPVRPDMTARMFLPPDDEPFEGKYISKSLQNLGKSIQSLLGSKTDLTFTWAESVRLIIEDLSLANESCDSDGSRACFRDAELSEKEKSDLKAAISKLEDELAALQVCLRQLNAERRETLNKLLDLKGNIRVFCRVRPFLSSEKQEIPGPLVVPDLDKVVIKLAGGNCKEYNFDKVFLPGASQDEIFTEVEPIIRSALDGHNVCIFAYGQTGTGKTFTMEGIPDCPGIVPHMIQELFQQASLDGTVSFTFSFSMLEVYMGHLRDLLTSQSTNLSIQMDAKGAVEVENLREVIMTNASQARKLYSKGSRARSTAWTNANESSSRSHCLIRITISCSGAPDRHRDTSKLWMVDLGGSERLLKTQATGQTMEEGKAINMSLSSLGDVISALQKKQAHIPYRNSKLTQILRDSIGEDSKTLMLVHISPNADDLSETVCSLNFATRARGIHLGRELSSEVKVHKEATMVELMQQMRCLEDDCQSARNNIQTVEFLLREKRKHLGKSDPSLRYQEISDSQASQETEMTYNIELGNVAQGSVGLPRYMNATTCSRIRGKSVDADFKTPGVTKKRTQWSNERKKSLSGSTKTVIFSDMDQSLCGSKSYVSNDSFLTHSSLSNKMKMNGTYSKRRAIDEYLCSPENNSPRDGGISKHKNRTGIYSKQGTISGSQCFSEGNTPKDNDKKINKKYYKQYSIDQSQCFSECNTPKDSVLPRDKEVIGAYSKEFTLAEYQFFSECNTLESRSVRSSIPHCKRVIAFQTSPNKISNKDILSTLAVEKTEPTSTKKVMCNRPVHDTMEYDPNPSQDELNSKQLSMPTLSKSISQIPREENKTREPCKQEIAVAVAAAATMPKITATIETETKAKTATISMTATKQTTGLCFHMVKIAHILWSGACLGVGLLNLGLEDDFFFGLLL